MHVSELNRILSVIDPVLLATALFFLVRQKLARRFLSVLCYLSFHLLSVAVLYLMLARKAPYQSYFLTYWMSAAIDAGLTLWCVGQMFSIALSPLSGIRRLASATFGCICTISLLVAAAMTVSSTATGSIFLMQMVSQITRFESVLVLCMLVFLAFASHMLGLSYRSRIFSMSLGFGVGAATTLFNAAYISHTQMNSALDSTIAIVASLPFLIWSMAVALPEPARRLITVPVDSWMLRWNDIAKSFGHGPAAVVVGEDPLQMMHPNEVLMHQLVMSRRSTAPAFAKTKASGV
jgi:hypothetical protein